MVKTLSLVKAMCCAVFLVGVQLNRFITLIFQLCAKPVKHLFAISFSLTRFFDIKMIELTAFSRIMTHLIPEPTKTNQCIANSNRHTIIIKREHRFMSLQQHLVRVLTRSKILHEGDNLCYIVHL